MIGLKKCYANFLTKQTKAKPSLSLLRCIFSALKLVQVRSTSSSSLSKRWAGSRNPCTSGCQITPETVEYFVMWHMIKRVSSEFISSNFHPYYFVSCNLEPLLQVDKDLLFYLFFISWSTVFQQSCLRDEEMLASELN